MRSVQGVGVADGQDQRDLYLAKAREADARAARATDALLREGWRKVAEGYRYLAERQARAAED